MKIKDLMAQPTVTLTNGDYLIANTRSEGYVPTFKETTSPVHLGQHIFRVVGIGTPDGVTGAYATLHIVPIVANAEQTALVEDRANPIAILEDGAITYMTGRNARVFKDGYHDRNAHVVPADQIVDGQEHRHLVAAFLEFADTEYSLGVNDFQIAAPDYLTV